MKASEETPKAKQTRTRSGVGTVDPPADVLQMVVECDPIVSEVEWLRLGRPTWTIIWLCHDSGQSTREAYASTLVPAYIRLCARTICPGKTGGIMGGIAVGNMERRVPCHWRQVGTEEAGQRIVRGVMGSPGRRYLWDYSGTAAEQQRYNSIRDEISTTPVFPSAGPPAVPADKPKRRRKPAGNAPLGDELVTVTADADPYRTPQTDPTPTDTATEDATCPDQTPPAEPTSSTPATDSGSHSSPSEPDTPTSADAGR